MADKKVKLEAVISATSQGMVDALKRASSAVNDSTASWKERFNRARGDLGAVSEAVKNLTAEVGQMGEIDLKADPAAADRIRGMLESLHGVFDGVKGDVESLSASLVAMRNEASAMGMPVEEYQRFADVVKSAGSDMQSAGEMIGRMRQMIQDFANGVPEAVELFGRLGITIEELGGRSPAGNLQAITEAINTVVPATEQARTSVQMYGRSIEEVLRISQEYSKSLAQQGTQQYATDRDVQGAIGLADALGRVGRSLDDVADKLNNVNNEGASVSQTGMRTEAVFRSLMDALDAYNRQLADNASSVYSVDHAYQILMQDIGRLNASARKHSSGLLDDASFNASINGMSQNLEVFSTRLRTEFDNLRLSVERNVSIGAPVDVDAIDKATSHLNVLAGAMTAFDRITSSSGFGREHLQELSETINHVRNGLAELRSDAVMSNLTPDILTLQSKIDDMAKSLDNMLKTPVKLRTEVDLKGIDELKARLAEIRSRANQVLGEVGGNSGVLRSDAYRDALKPLEDGLAHIDGLMHVIRHDKEQFNAEARDGVSIWTMLSRVIFAVGRAIGTVVVHPIRTVCDLTKAAWQWMTRFKQEAQGAGGAVEGTGKQLGRIFGMLTGMGSKVMIIVKGLRLIVDAAKEVAKWFTEAAKRQAEMSADIAGEAGEKMAANRKATDDRVAAIQKYVELLEKANRSGKKADMAAAEVARKELWEKHGVRADETNARQVFREISENAYDERIDQNEAETRMYKELIPQWRKAIEDRKGYLTDVFGKGWNLDQKLGEDTVLTDLVKKLGAAQKRLGELQLERQELGRTRRGAAYLDYVAGRGAENDDAMREMMRKQREDAEKRRRERQKSAEKADDAIADWTAELTLDEDKKKIRDVWKKYNEIVKNGGDREAAYQAAMKAIEKIREEAEKRAADEAKKLADEREKEAEKARQAAEKEEDARKRLQESYKALIEAQDAEAYRIRLDELGKARERLKRKMDKFGFTLPDGFKSSSPNMSASERRTVRMDDRIAEKLSRRQRGERVHFTSRELERIKALERLQAKDKALSAEEMSIRAAQTQASAAKTMKSASDAFWEAVKAFYEASTGKKLETKDEKKARERMERRERAREKNRHRNDPPEQRGGNRPSGWASSPGARAAGRGVSWVPAAPQVISGGPAKFLDWESYLARFNGSPQDAAEYYRKYVEMFNKMHGTSHEYKVGEFPNPYPEPEKQDGGVKLPPEFDNATRHQREVAIWNRRNHPEDYDDEGYWKYSDKGMARARERMQGQALQELVDKGFIPSMTGEDLAREISKLYAPPRMVEGGNAGRKDYTGLLERIETAIKNNKGNLTLK